MKSTISVLLSFALPFVIYGVKVSLRFNHVVQKLNNLAKKGTEINEALLLKKDGFLGEGGFGFVYEGTIIEDNRPVAIKFVDIEKVEICEREMAMYSYLEAYKNASVEEYGIPAVYYYGQWENYILIAFTKLDMNLQEVSRNITSFGKNRLDILILLRDFVYQSKYLHSHGVRHDDINPANIMLRGRRSFLIDFNGSSKMMEDNRTTTPDYECKRYFTGEIRRPIDDYESFLYTISFITCKNWFKPWYDNRSLKSQLNVNDEVEKMIKALADEVFTNDASKKFPNYNNLEKIVSREIKRIHRNSAPIFSWRKINAETSPAHKITDISEPKSIDFNEYVYPPIVHLCSKQATQTSSKISLGSILKRPSE